MLFRLFAFLIIAQIVCSLNKHTIVIAARNPILTWMTTYRKFSLCCSLTCAICNESIICTNTDSKLSLNLTAFLPWAQIVIWRVSWLMHWIHGLVNELYFNELFWWIDLIPQSLFFLPMIGRSITILTKYRCVLIVWNQTSSWLIFYWLQQMKLIFCQKWEQKIWLANPGAFAIK